MRPVQFLVILGILLAGLFAVQRPTPRVDLFGAIPAGRQVGFAQMTEPELYAAKLAHGRATRRYDVGLFGNSRAIMVGANDLDPAGGRFFNYAVPGSSFRTSVALAEDLARAGKLPAIVVISLDHLEIQFDGNPNLRGLGGWLRRLWRDLAAGLAHSDIGARASLRAAWRHLYVGYGGLTRYFNAEQLATGIRWRFAEGGARSWWNGAPQTGGAGYRRDGSRAQGQVVGRGTIGPLPRAAPSVHIAYLREDLRRLVALRRGGARIIVYESPIHPASLDRTTRHPSPHAAAMRAAFLGECARLALECYGQGPNRALAGGADWTDPTHPPARVLAAYVAGLIAPRRPQGRQNWRRQIRQRHGGRRKGSAR